MAVVHETYRRYLDKIGIAGREVFAQFYIRIYNEIPSSVLAVFSTLKTLQAPNFKDFRRQFRAKLGRIFLVPSYTFDNVKGHFPIGFLIWHTAIKEVFNGINADVYNAEGDFIGQKFIFSYEDSNIGKWVNELRDDEYPLKLGFMSNGRNDFQNQKLVYFVNKKSQMPTPRGWWITPRNLTRMYIFTAVRHCIEADWLNDRDQFLYPNDGWQKDWGFQRNCLIYTLFNGFNNIQSQHGVNHWIPFTEEEVDAKDNFESHFMSDYLRGKNHYAESASAVIQGDLFANEPLATLPPSMLENISEELRTISPEAQAVMDAGRELWRYYHQQPGANPNASFYDIRLHFQGTKTMTSGKVQMNPDSQDPHYTQLIQSLRQALKALAKQIEPKIYEYGFLKQ